jgi:hypothetical protein
MEFSIIRQAIFINITNEPFESAARSWQYAYHPGFIIDQISWCRYDS